MIPPARHKYDDEGERFDRDSLTGQLPDEYWTSLGIDIACPSRIERERNRADRDRNGTVPRHFHDREFEW